MKTFLILLMLGIATPALAQTSLPSDSPAPSAPRVEASAPTGTASAEATAPTQSVTPEAPVPQVSADGKSVTVGGVTVAIAPAATEEKASTPAPVSAGAEAQQPQTRQTER